MSLQGLQLFWGCREQSLSWHIPAQFLVCIVALWGSETGQRQEKATLCFSLWGRDCHIIWETWIKLLPVGDQVYLSPFPEESPLPPAPAFWKLWRKNRISISLCILCNGKWVLPLKMLNLGFPKLQLSLWSLWRKLRMNCFFFFFLINTWLLFGRNIWCLLKCYKAPLCLNPLFLEESYRLDMGLGCAFRHCVWKLCPGL